MRENCTSGEVRGAPGNRRPYRGGNIMQRHALLLALAVLTAGCAGGGYQTPTGYYQPGTYVAPSPTAPTDLLSLLEGCVIVANDGQPLGVITQNEFAANSLLNEFGKYGSEFSSTSIFNEFGKYGGEFSRLSPFNEFTRTPPQIISPSGKFVAYLTKNKFMTPAVDPHYLIGLLKSSK